MVNREARGVNTYSFGGKLESPRASGKRRAASAGDGAGIQRLPPDFHASGTGQAENHRLEDAYPVGKRGEMARRVGCFRPSVDRVNHGYAVPDAYILGVFGRGPIRGWAAHFRLPLRVAGRFHFDTEAAIGRISFVARSTSRRRV